MIKIFLFLIRESESSEPEGAKKKGAKKKQKEKIRKKVISIYSSPAINLIFSSYVTLKFNSISTSFFLKIDDNNISFLNSESESSEPESAKKKGAKKSKRKNQKQGNFN